MTSQWKVLARFKQLAPIDEKEAEEILPLCIINHERIVKQLRNEDDKDDVRVINASASLTYYDYALRCAAQADTVTSFKAGDITVSKSVSSITENAEKIKTDALLELAPLIKDTQFLFINI